MGSSVRACLETIQGEVSKAATWSEALADADGIVFVADSSPHARTANVKALAGIRERLDGRGRTAAAIPVVMQWNKRDRADARAIGDLESELNHRCFPSVEAVSLRGTGVAETLVAILTRAINGARRGAGDSALPEAELHQTVTAAIQRMSQSARASATERFGTTIELQSAAWPEVRESAPLPWGRENLWSDEPVFSAESIGGETIATPESETQMLAALERATLSLHDESASGLPRGLMAGLLAGCERTHGSLLLFGQGTAHMEECEVVPAGSDRLNAPQPTAEGTRAATVCSGHELVFIDDLADTTDHPRAALVVPLSFGRLKFGGMVVYVTGREDAPKAAEHAYWKTAAALTSVYLAWQASKDRALASRRTDAVSQQDHTEQLDH
jgi:hypothetical protein